MSVRSRRAHPSTVAAAGAAGRGAEIEQTVEILARRCENDAVAFEPLTPAQVRRLCGLIVGRVSDRLRAERGIELEVAGELAARLAADGFDEAFGARPLQRRVRRTLEKELTRAILAGRLPDGARVRARADEHGGVALAVALGSGS